MGSRSVTVVTSPLSSSHLFLFILLSSILPSMRPALAQDLSATETAVKDSDAPSSLPAYSVSDEFEVPANQTTTVSGFNVAAAETAVRNTPPPPETGLSTANSGGDGDDEDAPPSSGTRCQGYYDVMGQWDPPFNCNAGVFLHCCGTCFYRFCCQFRQQRLDQNICSNYDTPIWANTGKPVATITEGQADQDRDRTHLVVYIICGVVAIMVLAGIFAKLGLEKSRGGSGVGGGVADLSNARTLTDLLKQPGGEMTSVDVILANSPTGGRANGYSARMLRSRSEQYHLNNAGYGPFGQGLPHPHSNHSSLALNKYTSLKAVADTASRSYYKSFPLMDFSHYQAAPPPIPSFHHSSSLHQHHHLKDKSYLHQSPLMGHHHLADLHAPLSISIPPNHLEHQRMPKTTTLPVISGSAFKAWESSGRHVQRQTSAPGRTSSAAGGYHHHSSRRHAYSTRRQHSIENMPDLFGQPYTRAYGGGEGGGVLGHFQGHGHHLPHPSSYYHHTRHKSYSTHSKTEVTV